MEDKNKTLNRYINDYLVANNADNNIILNNLGLLCFIADDLVDIFSNCYDCINVEVDYATMTKMDMISKIKLVENFYQVRGIDFNVNKHIADGTIDFLEYDFFNDNDDLESEKLYHVGCGISYYQNEKKLINVCNNGLITDAPIMIHELSHFRDQPDKGRNQVSDLLTEALAFTEELIFLDYLSGLGYVEDANLFKKMLYHSFYRGAKDAIPIYEMFILFDRLGSVSKNNYKYFFEKESNYDQNVDNLNDLFENRRLNMCCRSWYILGSYLSMYLYSEYKKDPSFVKNIIDLHDKINTAGLLECFKIMGLNDFGREDMLKISNSLSEVVKELDFQKCKK